MLKERSGENAAGAKRKRLAPSERETMNQACGVGGETHAKYWLI
jgi:hypothetical protein